MIPATDYKRLITCLTVMCATLLPSISLQAQELRVPLLYIELQQPRQALLSNVLEQPDGSGLQGARLGISDNNTTGRFLQQSFHLATAVSANFNELLRRALDWQQSGNSIIIANLPAESLLQLANHPQLAGKTLVFNADSSDDSLRQTTCTSGLVHTLPSRAMLSDALAQFLVQKRWKNWLLVKGQRSADLAFGHSIERAAKRFGGKIVEQKTWSFETDLRRVAQQEIPAFTRAANYDVVVVADESGDVGEYIPYNTWLPRPVVGTQGLTPVGWHRVVEQWGAAQLQNRFDAQSGRWMNSIDYAAWLAVRAVGEAVTRTGSTLATELYGFLLSPDFELAAFKGRKLSFRDWNGQMRQPIALVHPRALISQSPQQGFLHPLTDLDTLGFDKAESRCSFKTTLQAKP